MKVKCPDCGAEFDKESSLRRHQGQTGHKGVLRAGSDRVESKKPQLQPPLSMEEIRAEVASMIKSEVPKMIEDALTKVLESAVPKIVESVVSEVLAKSRRAAEIEEERELDVPDYRITKKVRLDPKVIEYWRVVRAKSGEDLTLDDFINYAIIEHMEECLGAEIALIWRK